MSRMRVKDILYKKQAGRKITMLTAYDYPMAHIIDQCGVDIILVGDSLANVVLGLESTRGVNMEIMLHHAAAVGRAVKKALLVGDMPYGSYGTPPEALKNARRFLDEAGCEAVKVEWPDDGTDVVRALADAGIPVMGHVGLTPQTADRLGGMKVQGKDAQSAEAIIRQAKELERAGAFSLVLECVPDRIAGLITGGVSIPTIGIGAGPDCDGQVLVTHDLLGLYKRFQPKFVKQYVDLGAVMEKGINQFCREVERGAFPDRRHSFSISDEEFNKLKNLITP